MSGLRTESKTELKAPAAGIPLSQFESLTPDDIPREASRLGLNPEESKMIAECYCPLLGMLTLAPVQAADGQIYDQKSLEIWLNDLKRTERFSGSEARKKGITQRPFLTARESKELQQLQQEENKKKTPRRLPAPPEWFNNPLSQSEYKKLYEPTPTPAHKAAINKFKEKLAQELIGKSFRERSLALHSYSSFVIEHLTPRNPQLDIGKPFLQYALSRVQARQGETAPAEEHLSKAFVHRGWLSVETSTPTATNTQKMTRHLTALCTGHDFKAHTLEVPFKASDLIFKRNIPWEALSLQGVTVYQEGKNWQEYAAFAEEKNLIKKKNHLNSQTSSISAFSQNSIS